MFSFFPAHPAAMHTFLGFTQNLKRLIKWAKCDLKCYAVWSHEPLTDTI